MTRKHKSSSWSYPRKNCGKDKQCNPSKFEWREGKCDKDCKCDEHSKSKDHSCSDKCKSGSGSWKNCSGKSKSSCPKSCDSSSSKSSCPKSNSSCDSSSSSSSLVSAASIRSSLVDSSNSSCPK